MGGKPCKEYLVYGQPSINVLIIIVTVMIMSLHSIAGLTGEGSKDAAEV